jgi:pimeloyl-ACP methyl ester carboxylesterase
VEPHLLDPAPADLAYLDPGDGRKIALRHRPAAPGQPTILFLPGYASDMAGGKALAIDAFCASRSLGCLRLDYSGTGESGGDFGEGTLARWLEEVLAAIDLAAPDRPGNHHQSPTAASGNRAKRCACSARRSISPFR